MNFVHSLQRSAQLHASHTSTVFGERSRTWGETLARVQRLAAALQSLGVREGARVAILSLNSDRYFEMFYAVSWAGGVFVPLNTRWAVAETTYALRDCDARVLCVDESFADVARALQADGGVDHAIFIGEGPAPEGMHGAEALLAQAEPAQEPDGAGGDAVCGIFYTGGTTGHPKGVMLSHRNILFASLNWIGCLQVSQATVYMHVAGFFHLGGASPAFTVALAGGTNVILPKFEPVPAMRAIERNQVNYALLIPVMVNTLINDPALADHDLSSVKRCHYGGSPIPESVLRGAMARLPTWQFFQGYGLTETSSVITTLAWEHHALEGATAKRLKSAGCASYGWQVRIVGPDRKEVPRGEVGEIAARGDGIMLGYWGKPDATDAVKADGWMYTGDGAWMDEDGFVYIVDRLKDMIVSGGENIFSTEVENAIHKHPAVLECAVIGIPDEQWGEAVHAVVVPRPGAALTAAEVIAHCRTLIANYKCPKSVEVTTQRLPVSAAGKITKNVLRDPFWQGRARRVN
ncbi:acyl-CoA synthetase [Caenimonas aquaedulcis]|uniref:Long-chain fatty acid--CoA ligase n=1 Tax=Caenimonas aquaedulcis TaxID=2793270 RepID=A0A931H3R3_9BURK|nr:long-chain fatty acid--CoA ligase [Caenimonas aquaedulcis]MBG9388056.1 long-chain fatty acid--CoA ligase [Caenimonas aquaedulcis]